MSQDSNAAPDGDREPGLSAPDIDGHGDAELATRFRAGDLNALGALYQRHLPALYDFLARTVRKPAIAEDLAQTTFVQAFERRATLEDPARIRAWLFSIAHNLAMNQVTRQRPTDQIDEALEVATGERGPEEQVLADDAAQLVWAAAASLEPRQYAVLDLTVRQELTTPEVAEAMGLPTDHVAVLVHRAREALGNAVRDLLLVRQRATCARLTELVPESAEFTPELRSTVDHHLRRCESCQKLSRRLTAPAELFGALAPLPVPAAVRDGGWQQLLGRIGQAPAPAGHLSAVQRLRSAIKTPRLLGALGGGIAALAVATALAIGRPAPSPTPIVPRATPTAIVATATLTPLPPSPTPAPSSIIVLTYSGIWHRQRVRLATVPNRPVQVFADAQPIGWVADFQTGDPRYRCLRARAVRVWKAPREFPGLLVAHAVGTGPHCASGTWAFVPPLRTPTPAPRYPPRPAPTRQPTARPIATRAVIVAASPTRVPLPTTTRPSATPMPGPEPTATPTREPTSAPPSPVPPPPTATRIVETPLPTPTTVASPTREPTPIIPTPTETPAPTATREPTPVPPTPTPTRQACRFCPL